MHRHELFNKLLEASKSKTTSYLEIGVDNPNSTFTKVFAKKKTAVDPYSDESNKCHVWDKTNRHDYLKILSEEADIFERVSSDEYFEGINKRVKFDLIFIDGLHTAEQVKKDVENSLLHLKKGGYIILDDALPNSALEAVPVPKPRAGWRGTIYKYIAEERMNPKSKINIFCNQELNIAVIQDKAPEVEAFSRKEFPNVEMSYEFYNTFKKELMRILPLPELLKKLNI